MDSDRRGGGMSTKRCRAIRTRSTGRGKKRLSSHRGGSKLKLAKSSESHNAPNPKEVGEDWSFMPKITDLKDFQFRSELLRLMGTEDIRLNDYDWNRTFKEKLNEDYERLLDEQERNLAQAEKQRIHRLRLDGIIQDEAQASKEDTRFPGMGMGKGIRHSIVPALLTPLKNLKKDGSVTEPEEMELNIPVFVNKESNIRERQLSLRRQKNQYRPSMDFSKDISAEIESQDKKRRKEGELTLPGEKLLPLKNDGSLDLKAVSSKFGRSVEINTLHKKIEKWIRT